MSAIRKSAAVVSLLVLALALLPLAAGAQEEAAADPYLYTIDLSHSSAGFKVRHLTVSNVSGKFGTLEGTIRYNPDDLSDSGVEVTIDAATIDTNNAQRDDHLRSADFFEVETHPTIRFESTKVEKTDMGLMLTGDLTMGGVTSEVSFPFSLMGPIQDPFGLTRMGIEAELTIDRRDWGLEWSRAMETGGLVVGHDVRIELAVEATRK